MEHDTRFMYLALTLARRGLGNVYPNPAVGCVITQNNVVVGRGWTFSGGRPHAETIALQNAGEKSEGSTVYVTLEPCCHDGVTGPCTLALIKAKVRRVVIAVNDPDCRVSGKGIDALKAAGIEVRCDLLQKNAMELNAGFFSSKILNRPVIAAKIATTLDGKIATTNRSISNWITNDLTRTWMHKQRAMYDAIMVGSNTIVSDDPMLNCRLPGLEKHSPIRIVIDRSGKIGSHHKLVQTARTIPTYIITDNDFHSKLEDVEYLKVEGGDGFLLRTMQTITTRLGVTRLLVEGGGILITELLKNALIDQFIWSRASKVYGAEGVSAVNDLCGIKCEFVKNTELSFGDDTVEIFDVKY